MSMRSKSLFKYIHKHKYYVYVYININIYHYCYNDFNMINLTFQVRFRIALLLSAHR